MFELETFPASFSEVNITLLMSALILCEHLSPLSVVRIN